MNRAEMVSRLSGRTEPWDMVVIGGGATGVGVAVDAASRGHDVVLLEQSDFGKGTSSRSTKLVHGGVRYLQQGNIALVMEALKERGILRRNAPHLVHDLRFIVPNYDWWEAPFYGIGLKVYDMLAGRYGFGQSRVLSKEQTIELLPTIRTDGLRGGVQYFDGQFDDARLLINLVTTAAREGATLVNYMTVSGLLKDHDGFTNGVVARDGETGDVLEVPASVVINATGPFTDAMLRIDDPQAPAMIAPSQGVHIVLGRSFLPGDSAIMVPHTTDGRVMFAIPWHDRALIGTTDTPIERSSLELEPVPRPEEIDFILETAGDYLAARPARSDILSVFAGIRPLVRGGDGSTTASLSREHVIHVSSSGLVTICGGKWTTYRHMAEECVDHAATVARLDDRPCVTRDLPIHGAHLDAGSFGELAVYGSDAPAIEDLSRADPSLGERLHEALPIRGAEVVWAARMEMARTVDDVLARRTRSLLLDARAAVATAPAVARLMAAEIGRDGSWQTEQVAEVTASASSYIVDRATHPATQSQSFEKR